METFPEHLARLILLAVGLMAALVLGALPSADSPWLLHHQFLSALLAVALLASALLRAIRPTVVVAGLLSQAGFVAIALLWPGLVAAAALYLNLNLNLNLAGMLALLCAAALLLAAHRRQARWDGRPPQRGRD